MNDLYLPIDWIGSLSKNQVKDIVATLKSTTQIIIFPSGEVSKVRMLGIQDLAWNDFFIKSSIKYQRDIIPIYLNGKNSFKFYIISTLRKALGLKFNYEMFLLIDEFFNKKNNSVEVIFGEPISYQLFNSKFDSKYWAEHVKTITYSLADLKI